jgi:glycerol kinase
MYIFSIFFVNFSANAPTANFKSRRFYLFMSEYILILDAGTTTVKSLIYDRKLELTGISARNVPSFYPGPRLVEQDPEQIYNLVVETARDVIKQVGIKPEEISCAGLATQRTSWVFWNGNDGKPLYNLVTWQDTRGEGVLQRLFIDSPDFNRVFPGVAPYLPAIYTPVMVAATKEISPDFAEALNGENVKWGNVDAWLLYKLTGGKQHATTYSSASNATMLDTPTGLWSSYIAQYVGMRDDMLPEIREESGDFGFITSDILGVEIPIYSVIADQQAAMFAQGCFDPSVAKCTNGSGTFVNVNIGEEYKTFGSYFTTIAWKLNGKISYMFEGNSYTAGSCLEWAEKQLQLFNGVEQLTQYAESVPDSAGVYFVPALGGMTGAPYHDPSARASFMGISPGSDKRHFARAILEAIAFAAADIIISFKELGVAMGKLSVSGGVSNSDIAVQLIANVLNAEIARPKSVEATGFGTAALAALHMGWLNEEEIKKGMPVHKLFIPQENRESDLKRFHMWKKALNRSLSWLE